jgi:hypothetical protein
MERGKEVRVGEGGRAEGGRRTVNTRVRKRIALSKSPSSFDTAYINIEVQLAA